MQTDVSYESSFRLSCPIPEWGSMFTAAALLLKIRGDGTDIEKQTFAIALCGVFGVLIIPLMQQVFYQHLIQVWIFKEILKVDAW